MRIFRRGTVADLPQIYALQNTPFRDQVFDVPLPDMQSFLIQTEERMEQGVEQYFLLEYGGKPDGFVWFTLESGLWFVTVWSRWLRTMFYCACLAAFNILGAEKIFFCVREGNQRMIRLCKEYGFRMIAESSGVSTSQDYSRIRIVKVLYYELTRLEFQKNLEYFHNHSLAVEMCP